MNTPQKSRQTFALEGQRGVLGLTTMTASGTLTEEDCGCDTHEGTTQTLAEEPQEPEVPTAARWEGPIGMEGELTGDGRLIENEALRWEDLPLPLRYVSQDNGAHDGAVVVGLIDTLERRDGGVIWGSGPLDLGSEEGREAYRQVHNAYTTGVSMDLDDVSFEVRVAADLLEAMEAPVDEEGNIEVPEPDADGKVTVATIASDDEVRVTTSGRIRAATIVAIPAFAQARITAAPVEGEAPDTVDEEAAALLASARIPTNPPAGWFDAPALPEPTPLTVTEDGRVYGHLALWGTCHTAHSMSGKCIEPPRSATDYSYFRLGTTFTAEGTEVATGKITLDTTHAGEDMTPLSASAHYENTGNVVADVTAGEDSFGVWLAGALRPGVTPEQVRALRAAPLSGDWRRFGGNLELVAALAVNMPGFPVPRPKGLVASGAVQSLLAAGMIAPRKVRRPGTPGALSVDDLRYLKRLADRERAEEKREHLDAATELARRVRASRAEMKVRAFAAARASEKEESN